MRLATRCDCCVARASRAMPFRLLTPGPQMARAGGRDAGSAISLQRGDRQLSGERRVEGGRAVTWIQGIAGSFAAKMVGSYTNVVGFAVDRGGGLLQGELAFR